MEERVKLYIFATLAPKPLKDAQIGGRFIFIPINILLNKANKYPTDTVCHLKTEGYCWQISPWLIYRQWGFLKIGWKNLCGKIKFFVWFSIWKYIITHLYRKMKIFYLTLRNKDCDFHKRKQFWTGLFTWKSHRPAPNVLFLIR